MDLDFLQVGKRISLGMVAGTRKVPGPASDRVITFLASTDGLDRHGTKVMPQGINIERYMSNPIVLFGHDGYGGWFSTPDPENIIGRSIAVRKTDSRLEADIEFLSGEINPNAEMIFQMVKAGALNAVSIGFIPREVKTELDPANANNEVPIITKSELLEISVVPIPSNPEALAVARSFAASFTTKGVKLDAKSIRDTVLPGITDALRNSADVRKLWAELIRDAQPAPAAQVNNDVSVDERGATSFSDMPLSAREVEWDGSAARSRMAKAASTDGTGNKDKIEWPTYSKGFFWFDGDQAETLGAYKLPFADVVDGNRTAIWRGVTAAAARLEGSDIPDADKEKIRTHIASYYSKAATQYEDDSIVPPWDEKKTAPPDQTADIGAGSVAVESFRSVISEMKVREAIRTALRN
jgi:HK97 family phage prohead protease